MPSDKSDDELEEILADWNFLIVDDNPSALSILRSMLVMQGMKAPLEALDGASAMELVKQNAFDCIITDIRMEPMNGAEFVRWVRHSNEAANPDVRIIAMSAYRDVREIGDIKQGGASAFIGKPVSALLLEKVLKAVAGNGRSFIEADRFGGLRRSPDTDDGSETAG